MKSGLYIAVVLLGVLGARVFQGEDGKVLPPGGEPLKEASSESETVSPVTEVAPGDDEPSSWHFYLGVVLACVLLAILENKLGRPTGSEVMESAPSVDDVPVSGLEGTPAESTAVAVIPEEASEAEVAEIDHSFVLAVALELERLEFRLGQYEDTDTRKKAMLRIPRRIDRKLLGMDYERGKLLGRPYREGMNCSPEFFPSDDPRHTEPTITRVLLPQVFYQDRLIQRPEIEVSKYFDPTGNERQEDR